MSLPSYNEAPLPVERAPYTIPSERSERATEVIIDCITLYPQQWIGALLTAELAVEHLQLGGQARKDMSILELGAIQPDGPACAKRITGIHKAFGVKRYPTPTTAANFVLRGAAQALDCIREASRMHAESLDVSFPQALLRRFNNPPVPFDANNEYADFSNTAVLNNFLMAHDEVLTEVSSDLYEMAEDFRARSRQAQQEAASKGH